MFWAGQCASGLPAASLVCELISETVEKNRLMITLILLAIFVLDAIYCIVRPNVGEGISESAGPMVKARGIEFWLFRNYEFPVVTSII